MRRIKAIINKKRILPVWLCSYLVVLLTLFQDYLHFKDVGDQPAKPLSG